ncbi:MAG: hypothetical protein QXU31_01335 [Archaeoglobaceae archaeon]
MYVIIFFEISPVLQPFLFNVITSCMGDFSVRTKFIDNNVCRA